MSNLKTASHLQNSRLRLLQPGFLLQVILHVIVLFQSVVEALSSVVVPLPVAVKRFP